MGSGSWSILRRGVGRRLPLGLFGLIGLVAAVESFVARHDADFGNSETIEWSYSARSASREATQARVLLFGDSQVKTGLLPAVIEEQTGLPSYNLAVLAGQAPASYFLFRRALEAGARPSAVVVDFKSFLLSTGPRQHLSRWPDLLTIRDRFELASVAEDADLFAHLTLARYLPTFRSRSQIRTSFGQNLRGDRASLRFANFHVRLNLTRNQGAFVMPRQVPPPTAPDWSIAAQTTPERWGVHPVNAEFLRRFLDLATSRRIPVFWVLPPDFPGFQDELERNGTDATYTRIVRRTLESYPNLTVLDGRHADYPANLYHDTLHLDRRGAIALSRDVGEILARSSDREGTRARWVQLPDYREVHSAAQVEDLDQTRLVLEQYDPAKGVLR